MLPVFQCSLAKCLRLWMAQWANNQRIPATIPRFTQVKGESPFSARLETLPFLVQPPFLSVKPVEASCRNCRPSTEVISDSSIVIVKSPGSRMEMTQDVGINYQSKVFLVVPLWALGQWKPDQIYTALEQTVKFHDYLPGFGPKLPVISERHVCVRFGILNDIGTFGYIWIYLADLKIQPNPKDFGAKCGGYFRYLHPGRLCHEICELPTTFFDDTICWVSAVKVVGIVFLGQLSLAFGCFIQILGLVHSYGRLAHLPPGGHGQ